MAVTISLLCKISVIITNNVIGVDFQALGKHWIYGEGQWTIVWHFSQCCLSIYLQNRSWIWHSWTLTFSISLLSLIDLEAKAGHVDVWLRYSEIESLRVLRVCSTFNDTGPLHFDSVPVLVQSQPHVSIFFATFVELHRKLATSSCRRKKKTISVPLYMIGSYQWWNHLEVTSRLFPLDFLIMPPHTMFYRQSAIGI